MYVNKFPLFLFANRRIDDKTVVDFDNNTLTTKENKVLKIKKANSFYIVLLKYLIPLFLLAFLVDNGNSTSLYLAAALSCATLLLYRLCKLFADRFALLVWFLPILVYVFSFFIELEIWNLSELSVSSVFSHYLIYSISLVIVDFLFEDFFKNNYKNYFEITSTRFLKVGKVEEHKHYIYSIVYHSSIVLSCVYFLTLVSHNYSEAKEREAERAETTINLAEFVKQKKSEKLQTKLDIQARKIGFGQLHKSNEFKSIQKYEKIRLNSGTRYVEVNFKGEKVGEVIKYTGKNITIKTFVIDDYWHFILNNKIYRVVSAKAIL